MVRSDLNSIATYGEYQYIIRDSTIKSEEQAIQRAKAEIKKYGARANEGYFRTTRSGLKSGQKITINSPICGINNETFKITRVTMKTRSSDSFEYEVQLLASENIGIIDVLGKLLVTDQANQYETLENEILVQVYGYLEEIVAGETWRTNPWGLNTLPIWVAGPHYPTDSNDRNRMPKTNNGARTT